MRDALKGYLALAGSVTDVTRQRALTAVKALVASGEATAEQVGTLVDDLLTQTRQNREAVAALVTYEVDRTLGRVGLASNDEVAELVVRVQALEAEVSRLRAAATPPQQPADEAPAGSAPAKRAPGRKGPATRATASRAARSTGTP